MKKSSILITTLTLAINLAPGPTASASNLNEEVPIAAKLVVGTQAPAADAPGDDYRVAEVAETSLSAGSIETKAASAPESSSRVLPKTETAKLPENEIPVLTGNKESKKAATGGLSRVMVTLGVLAILLGATIFGLKRFSKRRANRNQNTRIKVLTQYPLGPKKGLAIVQVSGEAILLGVTDHNISMLKTLSLIDDEFPDELPRNFNSALDDLGHEEADRKGSSLSGVHEQDDFAVRGLSEIRDKVSTRLRNMKHL